MKKVIIFCIAMGMTVLFGMTVNAEQTLVESVVKGCQTELDTYC